MNSPHTGQRHKDAVANQIFLLPQKENMDMKYLSHIDRVL